MRRSDKILYLFLQIKQKTNMILSVTGAPMVQNYLSICLFLFLCACSLTQANSESNDESAICSISSNPIYFRQARFTVISENLIRLEYGQENFSNQPTRFASNRNALFSDFSFTTTNDSLMLETPACRLSRGHY